MATSALPLVSRPASKPKFPVSVWPASVSWTPSASALMIGPAGSPAAGALVVLTAIATLVSVKMLDSALVVTVADRLPDTPALETVSVPWPLPRARTVLPPAESVSVTPLALMSVVVTPPDARLLELEGAGERLRTDGEGDA